MPTTSTAGTNVLVKLVDLIDISLDWIVAKIEHPEWWENFDMDSSPAYALDMDDGKSFSPSSNWLQGGQIIEREKIELTENGHGAWFAKIKGGTWQSGPDPLTAAMRAYVWYKERLQKYEVPVEIAP